MEGYDKLSFVDKIKYMWRVRKQTKLENGDESKVNKQKIINELISAKQNRKNKTQLLTDKDNLKTNSEKKNDYMQKYKIPDGTKISLEKVNDEMDRIELKTILGRELKNKHDLYENIIEIKRFLATSHENIPEADKLLNDRLNSLRETWGEKRLKKGIKLYEYDKNLCEVYFTKDAGERMRMQQEITFNPELAKELKYLRYYPEKVEQKEKTLRYQAVYSEMIQKERHNIDNIKEEKDR